METLGDRVKAEREAKDWTQIQLAARVKRAGYPNMTQGGIGQIERRGDTEPKCVVQLAAALGVSVNWLQTGKGDKRGGAPTPPESEATPLVALRSFVGAGDEVAPIEGDEPVEYIPAPPGIEDVEATLVRGQSMRPLYHDGDILFHRRTQASPSGFRDDIVVVQLKDGRRYVKTILAGTRKGRFHLVSINPAYPALEDQLLMWVAPILWVKKRQRY